MASQGLSVTGGPGGLTASYEDMETTAGLIGRASTDLLATSASCHRFLVSPDVLASVILDPTGTARFEAALLAALDGPGGLTMAAGAIGLRAVSLQAAVVTYRAADELERELIEARRFLQGTLAAAAVPVIVAHAPALVAAAATWYGVERLRGNDPAADLEQFITDHPGIVDEVVGSAPGFVSTLTAPASPFLEGPLRFATGKTLSPSTLAEGAGLLGLLYPEGRAVVTGGEVDESDLSMTKAPRDFRDLMAGLNYRDRHRTKERQGEIDVRVVTRTMPDGSITHSYIVDLPGTKDMQVNPAGRRPFVNDLGTNLHALSGDLTTYQRGVEEALNKAMEETHARPGDPVMLVGHSQGGMVAMRAANDFVSKGTFNVTHVVTAGAPVADMPVPGSVQVLSLENSHDLIPHLDARPNPDAANWTTVTFDRQLGKPGDNHNIGLSYMQGAEGLDASTNASVRAYQASARHFFDGHDGPLSDGHADLKSYAYRINRTGP